MRRPNRNREPRTPAERALHRAQIMDDGKWVSALCFATPRAINFRLAGWTTCNESVTCKRCIALLPALPPPEPREPDSSICEFDA